MQVRLRCGVAEGGPVHLERVLRGALEGDFLAGNTRGLEREGSRCPSSCSWRLEMEFTAMRNRQGRDS